ncbi:LSM domain-containing protein [Halalkalirubrum salinum]|uniref:LSM domain-containing protein n=1 Tax=Halalkalirubrum salinum TaxID=2563889 RepID=UPI0010FBB419|nr:LSM domain-containing protein [Halalkalirubrum salinum]
MTGRPLDVLEEALAETVTVQLKDDSVVYGVLSGYDQHMNVVLDREGADETTVRDPTADPVEDTTIIRGDNVVSITV